MEGRGSSPTLKIKRQTDSRLLQDVTWLRWEERGVEYCTGGPSDRKFQNRTQSSRSCAAVRTKMKHTAQEAGLGW